jgi:hypothetical protein
MPEASSSEEGCCGWISMTGFETRQMMKRAVRMGAVKTGTRK